jgi:hydrogenase nickel incorporation protein HypA/HybF
MHEMGITAEVLGAAVETAEKAGATRINRVRLTVGELTEIVPDSLQFAWEILTPNTMAEGAVLEINESGGRSKCLECGAEFDHDRWDRTCTSCKSFATTVLAGNELRIDDIDVDLPDEAAGTDEE